MMSRQAETADGHVLHGRPLGSLGRYDTGDRPALYDVSDTEAKKGNPACPGTSLANLWRASLDDRDAKRRAKPGNRYKTTGAKGGGPRKLQLRRRRPRLILLAMPAIL